jgi:hypothetical protein
LPDAAGGFLFYSDQRIGISLITGGQMFPSFYYDPFGNDEIKNSRFASTAKAVQLAHIRYLDVKRKSWWRQKLGSLTGRHSRLKELGKVREHHQFAHYLSPGIQPVKIDCIIGSENRADDFDARFFPLKNHNDERWIKIAELMLLNVTLPAVELIKVNNTYYVRDGHHRISVAKHFGQKHIDANVIEMVVAPLEFEPRPSMVAEEYEMEAQACPT